MSKAVESEPQEKPLKELIGHESYLNLPEEYVDITHPDGTVERVFEPHASLDSGLEVMSRLHDPNAPGIVFTE